MFDIEEFLLKFEHFIFDEHLKEIQTYKRRYGNVVSCRCVHMKKEKENIDKIMEKYIKLSKRFNTSLPLILERSPSSEDMSREDKITSGSYDVVG